MQVGCPGLSANGAFVTELMAFVDCQAQGLGQGGYQALAASGSSVSLMLTTTLTIFVALTGYRMILGQLPDGRDGVIAAAKIGMVLVLATSWPAFRVLAYDVVFKAPANLAAEIARPTGLPGPEGSLVVRLQIIDDRLSELAYIGTSDGLGGGVAQAPQTNESGQGVAVEPQRVRSDPLRDTSVLGQARIFFLASIVGAFALVRLTGGLMLALGPLFALFLLFDATRGLFEGWIRVLTGSALGAVAATIAASMEISLIDAWLAGILTDRYAGLNRPEAASGLYAVTLIFALVVLGLLVAAGKLAWSFRLPGPWQALPARWLASVPGVQTFAPPLPASQPSRSPEERSRALVIADAVAATQRREASISGGQAAGTVSRATMLRQSLTVDGAPAAPLGQAARRPRTRTSGMARRRDRTA